MPHLARGKEIQQLIHECSNKGITSVKDLWVIQEGEQDFLVLENMEWWEHCRLGEEVDRLWEAINNRRIRMHLGEYKLRWGYRTKGSFTIKEAYDLWKGVDNQPVDQKWKKLWKKKMWPKICIFCWLVMTKHILIG